MALLVYSDRCKWCQEIIQYVRSQPPLVDIVRFHNITTNGVPSKMITRVPTLVTNEGQMFVGADVKKWLESMVPATFESWEGSGAVCYNLDGSACDDLYDISRMGQILQPEITPDLERKISLSNSEALASLNIE
jgi:hypothetical protein